VLPNAAPTVRRILDLGMPEPEAWVFDGEGRSSTNRIRGIGRERNIPGSPIPFLLGPGTGTPRGSPPGGSFNFRTCTRSVRLVSPDGA
jgi:hypothetical protein